LEKPNGFLIISFLPVANTATAIAKEYGKQMVTELSKTHFLEVWPMKRF